jgi:DNA-binding protein YbaB
MGMFDMLGKLGEMKTKMEEVKKRLDEITVRGEAAKGQIKIDLTANRKVQSIEIDDRFFNIENKAELIDQLEIALSNALEKANNVSESEMKAIGKDMLPNIPGLF